MHEWQKEILTMMTQYKGRGVVQITGRHTGKSVAQSAYKRLFDDIYQQPITDLILTEGTVYGARYHCVEPVGGSWLEIETWCRKTFGNPGDTLWGEPKTPEPAQRWYMNNRKFWFRSEEDRMIFVLKWR